MREKTIRNTNLYFKWQTGKYSKRSLAKMFKISHIRVGQIIKKKGREEEKRLIEIDWLCHSCHMQRHTEIKKNKGNKKQKPAS